MSDPTPKEIRECYSDFRSAWADIRDEAAKDMECISITGPWAAEDRDARETTGRPCIHLDQINQYLNQTKGNVRKNKRAIKALPKGEGANDADAKRRSSIIMGIEDYSKAQPIYLNAFECCIERSYGFAVIRTEYRDEDSFDLDIVIKPIMNPDTVLLTPYYKQPDASDITEAFILDLIPRREFKDKYPEAKITDFTGAEMRQKGVGDWITSKHVQIGEFWKVEHDRKRLVLVATADGDQILSADEWEKAKEHVKGQVKRERDVLTPHVWQYFTNGLEILDKVDWAGSRIPIISCLGPERWMTVGGSAKRDLLSMVRFARDPQMLFDFLATQETEEAGMVPKVPFVGAKGQFESDKDAWEQLNRSPHAYVQYDPVVDAATQTVLPPPARPQYQPNFQEYELAKDSAARAIQAAMGITPLPTAAARRNEKSGIALEKIDDMEQLGAFAFVDRYENGFLANMGWQINELITPILDTEREMPVTEPDGKRTLLQIVGKTSHPIGDDGSYEVQGLEEDHLHTGEGKFDVTISTGPSYQSEREEQADFLDQLLSNLPVLMQIQPGSPPAKALALAIRMRPELGPIGQQIADIFDPPSENELPPEVQAIVQQAQAQIQQLSQENMALHMDRAGRVLEQQTKLQVERMKQQGASADRVNDQTLAQMQNDIKVLVALIQAKNQEQAQEQEMYKTFWLENHGAAHDYAMQAHQQAHEQKIAEDQRRAAEAQQANQIAADQQSQSTQIAADQQAAAQQSTASP